MGEHPILFSGEMVRAILEGRKTQTRRIIPYREHLGHWKGWTPERTDHWVRMNPYGQIGDRLWVRETWRTDASLDRKSPRLFTKWPVEYQSDGCRLEHGAVYGHTDGKWRPSIFMPRWASRLTLEITGVRVEQLQSISEVDAVAEGIEIVSGDYNRDDYTGCWRDYAKKQHYWNSPIDSFHSAWDLINGKRASWKSNPWVWIVEFRKNETSTI